MEKFSPTLFMVWTRLLSDVQHATGQMSEARPDIVKVFGIIATDCAGLGLTASKATAERITGLMGRGVLSQEDEAQYKKLADELYGRIWDEMNEKTFFSLSDKEAEYYRNPRKGWEAIVERFPEASSDVVEARRCFAVGRYAGSVFHSIQAVEVALMELGRFLKVNDPKSGWTAVSGALAKTVRKDHKDRTPFERRNFAFLEQIHGTVEALKNAWRNKVSHAQGKLGLMTADFAPEVAEEILMATRSFMRRLADDLPQKKH